MDGWETLVVSVDEVVHLLLCLSAGIRVSFVVENTRVLHDDVRDSRDRKECELVSAVTSLNFDLQRSLNSH